MQIDFERARTILREEANNAQWGSDPAWEAKLRPVIDAAIGTNKTFVAALGTGILAKAADLNADPLALKVSGGRAGSHSARALAKEVLAAESISLGIHIGVTGREPLNNQPFFRYEFIAKDMAVHPRAREALSRLVDCLEEVGRVQSEDEARAVLRAFLALRKTHDRTVALSAEAAPETVPELARLAELFVREASEGGRRAQAVAAGILSVVFGSDRVITSRVNDPDRRIPGDVAVLSAQDQERFERLYEVRDKRVQLHDLLFFVGKVSAAGSERAVLVAVSADQEDLDLAEAAAWAAERSVLVVLEIDWLEFVSRGILEAPLPISDACRLGYEQIADRLLELEVSDQGLESWQRGLLPYR